MCFDEINPAERAWFLEFLSDPQDIALLTVYAQLETAMKKIRASRDNNAAQPAFRIEELQPHEDAALFAIGKLNNLNNRSDASRHTHVYLASYYLRTGQNAKAADMMKSLKSDFPTTWMCSVFKSFRYFNPGQNEVNDAKELRTAAKKCRRDDQFIFAQNKDDPTAKRYWVEWLIRSNRSEEALAFLKDPANFPAGKDEAKERLIYLASAAAGNQAQASQVLQQLTKDDNVELLIINAVANPLDREKMLQEAVAKHENSGLARISQAELQLAQRKPEEAARSFWNAFEYTRVSDQAKAGFLPPMLALADTDPDKALEAIDQLSKDKDRPDAANEPVLYSTAAFAAIKKDDFGSVNDVWERTKSMRCFEPVAGPVAKEERRAGVDRPF